MAYKWIKNGDGDGESLYQVFKNSSDRFILSEPAYR